MQIDRKRVRIILLILSISLMLLPLKILFAHQTPFDSSGQSEVLYSKAMSAYRSLQASKKKKKFRHSWEKTISQFELVYKRFPESSEAPKALYMTGKLYYGLYGYSLLKKDLLKSTESYKRLVKDYHGSNLADDAQFSIAKIYEKKFKNRRRAYLEYQKVIKTFPKGDMVGKGKAKEALKRLNAFKPPEKLSPYGSTSSQQDIKSVKPQKNIKLAEVNSIRYWANQEYTRIVVDLDRETFYEHHMLKKDTSLNKPPRLYVDFFKAKLNPQLVEPLPIENGLLKRVRAGQYSRDKVRVVIDMHSIAVYNIFSLSDPYRLVIDVMGEGSVNKRERKSMSDGDSGDSPTLAQQFDLSVNTIVIDPGHGGKDPGAIGRNGLKEKDVVLKIAKKLKKEVEKNLGIKVQLTRSKDIFIPLEERTAFANTRGADLFVSIHVNASQTRRASGVETYYLNLTTDEESMRVAARENATSRKRMSDLQLILNDLLQTAKLNESSRLAAFVQETTALKLSKIYTDIKNLGVKQAPFYVLIGAQMPSILVEVSFISNPVEERRLKDDRYLDGIAKGILEGLKIYIDSMKLMAYQ